MSNERLPLWNALNINIRSNNHLEGWHNRLDKNAGGSKLRFYRLLQLLMEEADYVLTITFDLSWINRVYAVKQRLIIRYTGDYTSGRYTGAVSQSFNYMDGGVDDEEQDHKSHVILEYNSSKGGVDSMDIMTVISTSVKRYKGKPISSA
ncbi:hypothetical protein T08_1125 [Trichinella sp. T8]|nr:hypothetical protein T08_1125 [Trichinella sp. T8]